MDDARAMVPPMTTGRAVVTSWYRATEVILEANYESHASAVDCWSVGCILYEIWQLPRIGKQNTHEPRSNKFEALFPVNDDQGWEPLLQARYGRDDEGFFSGTLEKPSEDMIAQVKKTMPPGAHRKADFLHNMPAVREGRRTLCAKMQARSFPGLIQKAIQGLLSFLPEARWTMNDTLSQLGGMDIREPWQDAQNETVQALAQEMQRFEKQVSCVSSFVALSSGALYHSFFFEPWSSGESHTPLHLRVSDAADASVSNMHT